MSRTWKFRLAVASLTLVLGGVGLSVYASVCSNGAAYGLHTTSLLDALSYPPKTEDVDFFTQSGGVPNIMILLDSSGSMRRLPPNGPGFLGGTLPTAGVIGCGLDATSSAVSGAGTTLEQVLSRVYSSPCGAAVDPTVVGATFDSTRDYAHEASACPRFVNPNPVTGADGFDPDWYCGSTGSNTTCSGGKVNLFDARMVFHDVTVDAGTYDWNGNITGDGWSDTAAYPYRISTNNIATVASFCADLKFRAIIPATQGGVDSATICSQCLNTRGWFYDGRILGPLSMDGIPVRYPSLWYTGAYLQFFPPKFMVARKVLKDTIMTFSKVRAAIADFSGSGAQVVQQFSPTCDHPESNFDSSRGTYMNTLDAISFDQGTPLARALFDVGMYYHSTTLPWFGNPWAARTPWANGQAPGNTAGSYSVCYACQVSSVIVITDGVPKASDDGCIAGVAPLPSGVNTTLADALSGKYAGATTTSIMPSCSTGTGGVSSADCPECATFTGADDYKNNLARVAWYMHNFDLRQNSETTKDCQSNGGRQGLDLYTIGFNNTFSPGAEQILSNAAKAGGGLNVSANNAGEVRDALAKIVDIINTRSTSFSVATVSTLQSQAGHSAIVPRFDPAKSTFWKGHLFRFEIYSEFVNGCTPNGTGDLDCSGTCDGVFLQDSQGHFIQEDGTGAFKINDPNVPSCNESKCASCGVASGADAVPWWDAGKVLADAAWLNRPVYTAIDTNGDGLIDVNDGDAGTPGVIRLEPTDAGADRLRPYLNVTGTTVCSDIAAKIAFAGDTDTSTAINADATQRACVKEIIRYVLGADVFNDMNRTGSEYPPRASSISSVNRDLLKDRAWKLGDIFHSSPVVVDAPAASDSVLVRSGNARQVQPSLWITPVLNDVATGNAYDVFAKSTRYHRRRKVVVVGANDGMLHAFNGGRFLAGQDDPLTTGIDESKAPFDGYYERANSGDELWAFVPPDQLPKLHLLLGNTHYLFVDGTPMVREVWVDGSANALDSAHPADDKKQPWEFHTVAVVPQRRGGLHHFALDVTDAYLKPSESGFQPPRFLWLFPQPGAKAVLNAGETYADFLPNPPPIGPVRVKADSVSGMPIASVTPSMVDSTGANVPYHERWVTFLPAGFDPQYQRGRGVHMVDVWTGQEIFDFSYPLPGSTVAATDPRWALKYPVAATVGMFMWGKLPQSPVASVWNEGYNDTATFGDVGGQLWVLRFGDPATLDPTTTLATNWLGGRVFQMGGRSGAAGLCTNEPFFYMTINASIPGNDLLRVLAGTGDRYNLLDQFGGQCGPDNIRACLQRGCRVTMADTGNQVGDRDTGQRAQGSTRAACGAATTTDALSAIATCSSVSKSKVVIDNCPSYLNNQVPTTSTKDAEFGCTAGSGGLGCGPLGGTTPAFGSTLQLSDSSNAITQINKFFSILVFDLIGDRTIFTTPGQAIAYDAARLTEADLVAIDGALTTPATLSSGSDHGWVMNFNHAPTVTVDNVAYTVSRLDERTSSTSVFDPGAGRCLNWNTSQPVSAATATGSCFVSTCKQLNRRVHYAYGADMETGASCLYGSTGTLIRSTATVALVPPPAPQPTIFVNQKGQVQVSLTSVNTETGAKNTSSSAVSDPATVLEMLDMPRSLHDCRHANPNGPAPNCQ
jgi:type IV pilus assembly protein PilY1